MKRTIIYMSLLALFAIAACADVEHIKPFVQNGVIVDNYEPLWVVANDPMGPGAYTALCPMPVIGDEVIVPTHKDGQPGFRRMKIETGEIIWEWYYEKETGNSQFGRGFFQLVKRNEYFVTDDNKYLVFTTGKMFRSMHIVLDIERGKTVWQKSIPSGRGLHYDGNGYYYCNAENIYTPENSEYMNYYAYKINIANGLMEEVFRCRQEPKFYGSCEAFPFSYRNKKYMFVTELVYHKDLLEEILPSDKERNYGLIEIETGDTLLWGIANSDFDDVNVHNDVIYVFSGTKYMIFDMDKLQFIDTVSVAREKTSIYASDVYNCHYFYKNKLIIGYDLQASSEAWYQYKEKNNYVENGEPYHVQLPRGFMIDLTNNRVIRNVNAEMHASILDDIIYYTEGTNLYAIDINTGKKLIDVKVPKCYEAVMTSSVYKNAKGEKFIIVSSTNCTYCYPGL